MTDVNEGRASGDIPTPPEYSTLEHIHNPYGMIKYTNKTKVLKIWHYNRPKKIEITMNYIYEKLGHINVGLSRIPTIYLLNPEIIVTIQLENCDQWQMIFTLNGDELYSQYICLDSGKIFKDILLSAMENGWDCRPYMLESRSKKELIEQVDKLTETLTNLI